MAAIEERDLSVLASAEAEVHKVAPSVDAGLIRDLVSRAYDGLTPAKVQGFLPILIAHEVRDMLRNQRPAA